MAQFPHCDSNVLHAPGTCRFCDMSPQLQLGRSAAHVNFTGEHDPEKLPCPAENYRPLDTINQWAGNIPVPPGAPTPSWFWDELSDTVDCVDAKTPAPKLSLIDRLRVAINTFLWE